MENAAVRDTRNVQDFYKSMAQDEIIADLQSRRTPLVNICMNFTSDFQKGAVVRANNAFLGSKVVIVGRRKYNVKGAVGTQHY